MFSYFGSKSKVIHLYPKPKFEKIIEPFAGSARYSLRFFDHDILLVDKYEIIIKIWKYLQCTTAKEIMALPEPEKGTRLDSKNFIGRGKITNGIYNLARCSSSSKPCI